MRRAVIRLPCGMTRRMDLAVMDLPEPDSPTSPTFSVPMWNETPCTTSTSCAPLTRNLTRRPSTSSRADGSLLPVTPLPGFTLSVLRIEDIAQSVTQQVEAECRNADCESGQGRYPPLVEKELAPRRDQRPPLRKRPL